MRHLVPVAAFASCLLAATAALDGVGRLSGQAGVLLVVTRGEPGTALASLLDGQDLRVLDLWLGGRVLQLHAASLAQVRAPPDAVLAMVRLPVAALALPGCA